MADEENTMLVELIPTRHSFTYAAAADGRRVMRYERGQIYKVSPTLGMELIGTQRLRPATVAPPDPLKNEREAWASMLSELASLGPEFRRRFASALEAAKVSYDPSREILTGENQPVPDITLPPPAAGEVDDEGFDADGFGDLDLNEAMQKSPMAGVDFEDVSASEPPEPAAEKKPAKKSATRRKAKKRKVKKKA